MEKKEGLLKSPYLHAEILKTYKDIMICRNGLGCCLGVETYSCVMDREKNSKRITYQAVKSNGGRFVFPDLQGCANVA